MDLKELNSWMNALNTYFVSDEMTCKMNYITEKIDTLEQERENYKENIIKEINILGDDVKYLKYI